jgi:hypothetical protein
MKLKHREIAEYRQQQLLLNNCCCALCGDLVIDDAVLDHDHKTGLVRQVLHRGCNSMLGKIENNMARSRIDLHRLRQFAANLVDYIQTTHTDIVHPTHKPKGRKT